jgi:hypothetical protein
MSDGFATYSGRGPCFGLSHPDLVHPHCKLSLLGPVGLLPQESGLLVEELIQEDEVGDHIVQEVFLMAAPFQVPHAGLPDLRPDDRRKKPYWCGNEVFLEDPAQVAESLSDGQGIGILMLKYCGSHSPRLDVRVAGASGDGKNHPTAKSAKVFVLSAVVPWALSNTETLQGVDQKAGETWLFLANALDPTILGHLKTKVE